MARSGLAAAARPPDRRAAPAGRRAPRGIPSGARRGPGLVAAPPAAVRIGQCAPPAPPRPSSRSWPSGRDGGVRMPLGADPRRPRRSSPWPVPPGRPFFRFNDSMLASPFPTRPLSDDARGSRRRGLESAPAASARSPRRSAASSRRIFVRAQDIPSSSTTGGRRRHGWDLVCESGRELREPVDLGFGSAASSSPRARERRADDRRPAGCRVPPRVATVFAHHRALLRPRDGRHRRPGLRRLRDRSHSASPTSSWT